MMRITSALVVLALTGKVICDSNLPTTTTSTEGAVPKAAQPVYVPEHLLPYFDNYRYDSYHPQGIAVKMQQNEEQIPSTNYGIMHATQSALQFTLKALAKFGLFLLGGAALLLVGGMFTTIMCNLTPICVISFPGINGINKESVRSLMTPDKISAAAAMVQDAIGKYQRLQRTAGTNNN